jgi:hypothetical protein
VTSAHCLRPGESAGRSREALRLPAELVQRELPEAVTRIQILIWM